MFGVRRSPEFETPLCWYVADANDYCLSYGTDWLLEERANIGTTMPDGRDGDTSPEAIYFAEIDLTAGTFGGHERRYHRAAGRRSRADHYRFDFLFCEYWRCHKL